MYGKDIRTVTIPCISCLLKIVILVKAIPCVLKLHRTLEGWMSEGLKETEMGEEEEDEI